MDLGGCQILGVWVGVLDSALSVCIRTGELSIKQILHYLFILADDVGVYIRPQFVDDFIHELEFSLKKYGLQIKDFNPETQAGVNQGCCDSFEFLGFDIKHGVTVPNLAKLFVQTIWPERLLEGVSPIGQMATRARGISRISKGCHPEISLLCEALSNRCLYNTRISRYNDFGFLVDGGLQ